MITIKIPSEIKDYKSKLIFGFTTRQIISIGVMLGVCVPIGVFGKGVISEDVIGWLIILIAAPIIAWGFFSYKDMMFEDFIKVFLEYNLLPQKRVYEDTEENLFCHLNEEIHEIDIIQQRIELGEIDIIYKEWDEK